MVKESWSRWMHANLVYRPIIRLRGEQLVFSKLAELERVQFCPIDLLTARQDERLAEILTYASRTTPYYESLWGGPMAIRPGEARDRLRELPLLSKTDLRSAFDMLLAEGFRGPKTRKTTGGSTGQAVTVLKDRRSIACEMAASWLGYGWFGVRMGDKAARFWGQPHTIRRRLRSVGADCAMRRVSFSAFHFDGQDLEHYWRRCRAYRPAYLYGYVSMLEAFANHIASEHHDGRQLGLKVVITTSEVLHERQRDLLEATFGAPVQNEYGCGEVGPIAYQCERGALHCIMENTLVEVLTPEGRPAAIGEPGEIVITDLNNRAMPLIRYRVGDLGALGAPCSCKRGFATLQAVWGREYEFVLGPDGRRYHGEFFMYAFEDLKDAGVKVEQFQVSQLGPTSLDVAVVLESASSPASAIHRIKTLVASRLPDLEVGVREVASIPRASSGKMRLIQNLWLQPDHARSGGA